MRVAVVGGTGTFGKLAVGELKARGHDVVTLSRTRPAGAGEGEHRAIDLSTGAGLPEALDGTRSSWSTPRTSRRAARRPMRCSSTEPAA